MNQLNSPRGGQCYVIAEAGLNHNGSVAIAKKLIDVAHVAGADAVKFQKRTVENLAVNAVLDAPDDRFPQFGNTYRKIREHLEFDERQYRELKNYSESKGLDFIVTAFDIVAVDFLIDIGIQCIKLASHSLTNSTLLDYVAKTRIQTVLSTGMAELDEVDEAVAIFVEQNAPLVLMHCVSAYPTPLSDCNLNMIEVLKQRYGLVVGYSGHELGYLPSLMAVARGAHVIERHFTLDKSMVGFDHKISLEPAELCELVKQIRSMPGIIGSGEKGVSDIEWITRRKYHVSMTSASPIRAGAILTPDMVVYRNPGTGIPHKSAHTVLGKKAKHDIGASELLSVDMFE